MSQAIILPQNPAEEQVFLLSNGKKMIFRDGAWRLLIANVVNQDQPFVLELDRYDLRNDTTTGVMDLSVCQTFQLKNNTATAKSLSFVNIPTTRAITIVLQVEGKAGTLTFPQNITWPSGAPSLKDGQNLFVFYSNGGNIVAVQAPSA